MREFGPLKVISETPDLLVLEATYPGGAPFPPAHLHPNQEERFTVLDGTMVVRLDGEERPFTELVVPPGTPHTMRADGPARMRWEVRPALRTAEFFTRLYGGTLTSLEEFEAEIRLA